MEGVANVLVGAVGIYLAIGLLFAIPFAVRGVQLIDPAAEDGTVGFRILIVPGAAALWPLLLSRWISGVREPPAEHNAHRDAPREEDLGR
jgi:hypothetical protein